MMTGTHGENRVSTQGYNDAFQMVPAQGRLVSSFNNTLGQVTSSMANGGGNRDSNGGDNSNGVVNSGFNE